MMTMGRSFGTRWPAAGKLSAALGVALLAATACASSGSSAGSAASTTPASAAAGGSASSAASGTEIMTGSGSAGTFLVDGTGRALYLWEADSTGKSTCSGACASAWPPVPATGKVTVGGGAVASDLSTITAADGSKQVAYDGHALYYFVGDKSAGQTNGQGSSAFGAKWWLVAPAGTAITSGGTASQSGGGGY
jgi:predicted lipoprotein with Yx(FWY)xxD motif